MFVINLFALLLSKKLMISQSKHYRVTIKLLEQMKNDGEKISMLTAYDYSFAKIIDNAGWYIKSIDYTPNLIHSLTSYL